MTAAGVCLLVMWICVTAVLAGAAYSVIRSMGTPTRYVPADLRGEVYLTPRWWRVASFLCGLLLCVGCLVTALSHRHLAAANSLAIGCAVTAILIALLTLLACRQCARSFVVIADDKIVIGRWRGFKEVPLRNVEGIVTFYGSAGVRLNDGRMILLPEGIAFNLNLRAAIERKLLELVARRVVKSNSGIAAR